VKLKIISAAEAERILKLFRNYFMTLNMLENIRELQ